MLRTGQKITFADPDVAFNPCFLNNHWIGFRVDKSNLTIECVWTPSGATSMNSMNRSLSYGNF